MPTSIIGKDGTKLLATIGVIFVAAALVTLPYQNQVANVAPSVKKIRVIDGGLGVWSCSASGLTEDGGFSSSGSASQLRIGVTADKITGKVAGTWQIIQPDFLGTIGAGDISGGKMKANSFSLSGTETSLNSFFSGCGPTPIPVTFTGQCGTDVTISFKADKQQPALAQTQEPSSETLASPVQNKIKHSPLQRLQQEGNNDSNNNNDSS